MKADLPLLCISWKKLGVTGILWEVLPDILDLTE